jgi:hypothetical protein
VLKLESTYMLLFLPIHRAVQQASIESSTSVQYSQQDMLVTCWCR